VAADDYSIKVKVVLEEFERKLAASVKKVQPIVKETFLGVLDIFAPELSLLLDSISREMKKLGGVLSEIFRNVLSRRLGLEFLQPIKEELGAEERRAEGVAERRAGFLERMTRRLGLEEAVPAIFGAGEAVGGAGAAGAGVAGAAGAAAAPAALAVVAVQSLISIIKQVLDYLKRVSAVLGAVFKLIETSIMLLIKPIADFIGYMLKPIVMLILRFFVIPFYRTIAPIIKEMGDLWDKIFTAIMTPLMPILKEAAQIIAKVLPYILPVLLPVILSLASAILGPLILISLVIKGLQILVDWIWKGLQWIWKGLEGFAKWWATVVWSGIVRFFTTIWDALKNFVDWLRGAWNWVVDHIFKPIYDFLKSIADAIGGLGKTMSNVGKGISDTFGGFINWLKGTLGFQWGGVVQRTGFYRLHAGERVVPPGEMVQTVFVYPRIEIGSVYLGSERDLSRLEERINKAIADALRRRRA